MSVLIYFEYLVMDYREPDTFCSQLYVTIRYHNCNMVHTSTTRYLIKFCIFYSILTSSAHSGFCVTVLPIPFLYQPKGTLTRSTPLRALTPTGYWYQVLPCRARPYQVPGRALRGGMFGCCVHAGPTEGRARDLGHSPKIWVGP